MAKAPAAPVPAWAKRGLTLSGGLGYGYGFLGAQARYDLSPKTWLHVAPFVATGLVVGAGPTWLVGAAGVSAGLGFRHRLAIDFAVAPVGAQLLDLHGVVVDHRTIYGPNLAAGYELFTSGGFLLRFLFGYGWGEWGKGSPPFPSEETLSLGVGWRIW